MSIKHHLSFTRTAVATLLTATLTVSITGCSGSGGGDGGSASTTIDGTAFASAVNGATCQILDVSGNIIVDSITTSATGGYSASIPNAHLTGDLVLECNGGTYTDEATGTSQTAGFLAAYADANTLAAGVSFHATPESTIMHRLRMQHRMTLADAQTAFNAAFGYTPDNSIAPTDATSPTAGATDDELLAGLRAATFSQLTLDLGLTPTQQFELLLALADDLSDGPLDGSNTTGIALPIDIQNQFATAMLNFRDGGNDNSGLENDEIGTLPFAQTALTASYKVEYIEGVMEAMEGKSQFQIRVTNDSDSTAATGLVVTLMPMMYMAGDMSHSTPVDGACVENASGVYDCTIYYLMASTMMDMSMGYWDLTVMVGGEKAHFYPPVMEAMNDDITYTTLKNSGDQISGMMMGTTEARLYFLFKSNLTGMTDNHNFELFIAAKEDMMNYPAVTGSNTLSAGTDYALDTSTMTVEIYTNPNGLTSFPATGDGTGYWTATGITGLTDGEEGVIYVRMTINGTQYSTDGVSTTGSAAVATFTVMPMSM